MMTDKIEPALTAEEWAHARGNPGQFAIITLEGGNNEELGIAAEANDEDWDAADVRRSAIQSVASIAALNFSLPDSDPRKITRAKIEALRFAASFVPDFFAPGVSGDDMVDAVNTFADALESYLPPAE